MYILIYTKRENSPNDHDDYVHVYTSPDKNELQEILNDEENSSGGFCGHNILDAKIVPISTISLESHK